MNTSLRLGGIGFDGHYALVAAVVASPQVAVLDDGNGRLRVVRACSVSMVDDDLPDSVPALARRELRARWVREENDMLGDGLAFVEHLRGRVPQHRSRVALSVPEKQQLIAEATRIVSGDFLDGMVLPAYLGSVEDAQLNALSELLQKVPR